MPISPDPFYQPVYYDSCAFDGGDPAEQAASIEAKKLFETHDGDVKIVHSVKKEIDFPSTPKWVKTLASSLIYTIKTSLNKNEINDLREVQRIIIGNGNLEKRSADCRHVFEAQKYGRYFVTTDKGILRHSNAIRKRFNLYIIKPTEFLQIVKEHIEEKP